MFSCNTKVESYPQLIVEGSEDDEIVKAIKQINLLELYEAEDKYKLTLDEIWADLRSNGRYCDEKDENHENKSGYQQNETQNEIQSEIRSESQFKIQSETQSLNYYNDILSVVLEKTQNQRDNFDYLKLFRRNRKSRYFCNFCVFCENNNEPEDVIRSHAVRDVFGRVLCPKLRIYVCPICGASGDNAHTIKYCPNKQIITMEQTTRMQFLRASYVKEEYAL